MWSRTILTLVCALLLGGCQSPLEEGRSVSIGYLRGLYDGYPRLITDDLVIEGEVVSSDRYGALPGQLVLQDATGGITVLIDASRLYKTFAMGDRVRVWCRGLTLGGYGGSVRLGGESERDWQVGHLSEAEWAEHSLWVSRGEGVEHTTRQISTLGPEDMGRYVRIPNVRVVCGGEPWPEEGVTESVAVVDHLLPSDTLQVRVTGHREIVERCLPDRVCTLWGVADYFAGDYQVTILSPDGFQEH